uniref:Uncharacterized protein n=1 Tax=Haplochromis burtoni TaxID=8153 RepID=A0A3Q2WNB3_HAPBU
MATGVCMLLVVGISVCAAFNLDTSFPLLKMGERGSLFGFSVALHQDLKTESYLLNLRSADLYCPQTKIHADELVEDMWLGVSVASQGRPGGRVLVSLCSDWLIIFLLVRS